MLNFELEEHPKSKLVKKKKKKPFTFYKRILNVLRQLSNLPNFFKIILSLVNLLYNAQLKR